MASKDFMQESYPDPYTQKAHWEVENLLNRDKVTLLYSSKLLKAIQSVMLAKFFEFRYEVLVKGETMVIKLEKAIKHEDRERESSGA